MRVKLRVDVENGHFQGGAVVEVPDSMIRCFQPVDLCDEPIMAAIVPNGVVQDTYKVAMKTREDAADVLARELARLIVGEMKKADTHNGY